MKRVKHADTHLSHEYVAAHGPSDQVPHVFRPQQRRRAEHQTPHLLQRGFQLLVARWEDAEAVSARKSAPKVAGLHTKAK